MTVEVIDIFLVFLHNRILQTYLEHFLLQICHQPFCHRIRVPLSEIRDHNLSTVFFPCYQLNHCFQAFSVNRSRYMSSPYLFLKIKNIVIHTNTQQFRFMAIGLLLNAIFLTSVSFSCATFAVCTSVSHLLSPIL